MRLQSNLSLQPIENEMETIAWASMEDDQIIERLAQEVWRTSADHRGGRVGFSKSKVRDYVRRYALGHSRKAKRKLVDAIMARAEQIFQEHCHNWASEVVREVNRVLRKWPPRRDQLKTVISGIVPRGARKEVEDIIARDLGWY